MLVLLGVFVPLMPPGTVLGLTSCNVGSAFNRCMPKVVSFAPESKHALAAPKNGHIPEIVIPVYCCTYQSLLRAVRSESCHFGHTPVQDRLNDTKGKPQNGFRVAPEGQT